MIVSPLITLENHWERELEHKRRLMGRYKFLQENYAQVNKSLKALKDSLAQLESQFLSGNTTALAASDLQDIIRHITETLGLKVGSIQVIPPRESGAYLEIPIRIQFNANYINWKTTKN